MRKSGALMLAVSMVMASASLPALAQQSGQHMMGQGSQVMMGNDGQGQGTMGKDGYGQGMMGNDGGAQGTMGNNGHGQGMMGQ